ncbi:unnamed protein product [Caenorhabditis nigoni]
MTTPSETVQKEEKEPIRGTDETAFQFNLFADLLHGIHPDNNGDDDRRYRREEPIQNHMNSVVEFIGGFEKWNECKLGICSKRDYETVKSTPLDVNRITIENFDDDNLEVTVKLGDYYSRANTIQLIFSQHGEDTQVQWYEDYLKIHDRFYKWPERFSDSDKERLEKRILVLKSCNYKEEAVKFAEKWMKKCNFELKYIDIEMKNYPMDRSHIKSLPKCRNIRIGADDVETFRWWIQKLPNQMKDIQLLRFPDQKVFTIPSDLLNAPQIMDTYEFDFWCRADFSDEQFLNLEADTFDFHVVNITDQGISEYIKKWVNGNGVPGFRRATLRKTEDRNFDEMTRGIECREWYGDFDNDATSSFCRYFYDLYKPQRCVQIYSKVDPYESLTLGVASDRVLIYKTGNKLEENGRTYSNYSIPD